MLGCLLPPVKPLMLQNNTTLNEEITQLPALKTLYLTRRAGRKCKSRFVMNHEAKERRPPEVMIS